MDILGLRVAISARRTFILNRLLSQVTCFSYNVRMYLSRVGTCLPTYVQN